MINSAGSGWGVEAAGSVDDLAGGLSKKENESPIEAACRRSRVPKKRLNRSYGSVDGGRVWCLLSFPYDGCDVPSVGHEEESEEYECLRSGKDGGAVE